ncbi:MAG: lipopolysaccharide biosynthesis protein [Burkholderiaceae bacterium]|nr:lipopolysaccharide biosynthesis protein [Burkholderiaceae bacterium]
MTQTIQGKMARGATWMLGFRLADRALAFVSTIILARVLVPADFGLVAMAMSVIAMIELAGAFSFEVPLIQRADPTRAHYDTTWTLRLLFSLLCGLLIVALALPAAAFYGDARIAPIMLALSVSWLIEGFENIGTVNFRREMNFRREFIFMFSKRAVGVGVTLSLALAFRSYWALIIGTIASRAFGVLLSYAMQSYRPRLSLAMWRELFGFSGWLFAMNVVAFLQTRLSHFVIGRTQGAEALGIFTVSSDVAALASNEITAPINRAVMPGLSRIAEEPGRIGPGLLQVAMATQLITMPAAFGLAAVAEPLVLTLLGQKWAAAIVPVQILAFAGALQAITAANHSAYLAVAKAHVPAILSAVFVAALIPLLYLLHPRGIVGVAWAQLGAVVVYVTLNLVLMKRYFGVSLWSLLRATSRCLIAAIAMGALVDWLVRHRFGLAPDAFPAVLLALGVLTGIAAYTLVLYALWQATGRPQTAEAVLFGRLRSLIGRPRAA